MQYYNYYMQCPFAQLYSYAYPADESVDLSRAQRDIQRVLPLIFQRTANEINQAIALGMKPHLVSYLIREMVEYIDRNYKQYSESASYNITEASEGIKVELYWILNIFRIYGVPFEVQIRLLNNTVITSMQNLRVPANNVTTSTMRY